METALPTTHTEPERHAAFWDRIGIWISGACMVHCLLLPVALTTLSVWPVMGAVHAWLHPVFALLLVPTTAGAARHGWRHHRRKDVVALLAVGLAVVLVAGILGHLAPGALVETAITVTGSILLITGHWRNWRFSRPYHMPAELHPASAPAHRSTPAPEETCIG
ncbi:MAG TPA: MerC domain-containing protein [Rhodothermales bacterium]|nr:MerC domain-containing protein [Rhodothermales bacterium]